MPRRRPPFLDAFVADLDAAVRDRGEKARLARFLAENLGIEEVTAASRISRILSLRMIPSGETVLAVQEWMRRGD